MVIFPEPAMDLASMLARRRFFPFPDPVLLNLSDANCLPFSSLSYPRTLIENAGLPRTTVTVADAVPRLPIASFARNVTGVAPIGKSVVGVIVDPAIWGSSNVGEGSRASRGTADEKKEFNALEFFTLAPRGSVAGISRFAGGVITGGVVSKTTVTLCRISVSVTTNPVGVLVAL